MRTIGGRTFPGQPLHQGIYIPITTIAAWETVHYVTSNGVEDLMQPGYFNQLHQMLQPPAKIEVASYSGDPDGSGEWRYFTLAVTGNTFDAANPGAGGAVSVRLLLNDHEPIAEASQGRRSIHKGAGKYAVLDESGNEIATGLTKAAAEAIVMQPDKAAA